MTNRFCLLILVFCTYVASAQSFIHPGLLQSRQDLDRIKRDVATRQEPVYSGYRLFREDPASSAAYKIQGPLTVVGRNPTVGQGIYDSDASAAYQCALMWCITGDTAYAQKAKEIVNAWSYTLQSITGRDAILMAGLGPFKMINAAEILRYTGAGWSDADVRQAERCFKTVVYPVLKDFAPFANGNWDAAAIKTVMATGVFCNDRALFEKALRYYVSGPGNGSIEHYIHEDGQIQESGRDQQHTQLGIGLLADCCEIAWHQGLDLFGYADNRLLKGFEYVAKYNLGYDVPFTPDLDRTGKYRHDSISAEGRGRLRSIYEEVYHHYLKGAAPYTGEAAAKIRPEGPGRPAGDHTGYGTLLYAREDALSRASHGAPGGLIAHGSATGNALTWIPTISGGQYTIKRSLHKDGPYTIIGKGMTSYTDHRVTPGKTYYYTVGDSYEASACAGLPSPWKAAVGDGRVDFDGKQFTLEGNGRLYHPMEGDGMLTCRFFPQPGSQFSTMGLILGGDTLLLRPGKTTNVEAPDWNVNGYALKEPFVTYGRLTGYTWLRLTRTGDVVTGYVSPDGQTWSVVGRAPAKDTVAGIVISSGIDGLPTTVQFDQVNVFSTDNQVYQYSVDAGGRTAYLWIPPACRYVRGVIIALSNLLERNWLEDPLIRQTAAEEGLGIIWVGPGPASAALTADMKPGAGAVLEKMLDDLATVSGYQELASAPIIPMGHSANGHFAWTVPNWNAARTIASIPIKTVPLPDYLGFTGVPLCYIVGQTTEWPQFRVPDPATRPGDRDFFWPVVRNSAVALRAQNELVGVVTDPGGGHFDWSDHLAQFLSLYIHKACLYRLPAKAGGALRSIDPTGGWLTDIGGMDSDQYEPAPYKSYTGDPRKAYWFFDKETALAAAAFEGDRKPREKQMLTFVQDGQFLPVAKQGFAPLRFEPDSDGVSFTLRGDFLTQMPPELTGSGTPLGHAPGPIGFRVITGPAVQTGPNTFRVRFDRAGMTGDVWIQAYHPGDDRYRPAVQPGRMQIPTRLTMGTPQVIHFPAIPSPRAGVRTVALTATSDAGLPVDYYVVAGPAVVEGRHLRLTGIPVRTKYPVKITVVAYQWGRPVAPLYQSAEPVTRVFFVN